MQRATNENCSANSQFSGSKNKNLFVLLVLLLDVDLRVHHSFMYLDELLVCVPTFEVFILEL